ncbi:MAG: hypothetical protein AABW45_02155 [Nanoarchaeota archaeon]|mgnify:CR=1 FL=1
MENLTKEEREKLHEQEKLNLINQEKNKKSRKKFLFIIITLAIVGGLVYIGVANSLKPGEYDDFAKCLTEKKVKEYGAFWCPNCAEQKKLFGKSFKYVDYIECDARGDNAQPELCQKEGITGYPTWEYNNTKYPGVRSLEELSEISGCSLNS